MERSSNVSRSGSSTTLGGSILVDLLLIWLYVAAIIVANGLVTQFGQLALPFTAFCLIPFDLVVRDLLQDRWQVRPGLGLWGRMATLILAGSFISGFTTVATERIATASFVAFLLTGAIDALTYQRMIKYGRIFRINAATWIAAATDSVVFVLIAFGPEHTDPGLVGAQILCKIAGGFVWSLAMYRFFQKGGARMFETAMFLDLTETMCNQCYEEMKGKGFWDGDNDNAPSKIALMHSELSELLEAFRKDPTAPCDKEILVVDGGETRRLTQAEEEVADLYLRLADFCGRYGIDLGRAILAKRTYNRSRPFRHGKKC